MLEPEQSLPLNGYYYVDHLTTKINVSVKRKYVLLTLIDMKDEILDLIECVREEFEVSNENKAKIIILVGDFILKVSGQKKSAVQTKSAPNAYFKRRSLPANSSYKKQLLALDEYTVDRSPTKIDVTAKKKYGGLTLIDMENDVMDLFALLDDEFLRLSGGNITVSEGDLVLKVSGPKESADNVYFKEQSLAYSKKQSLALDKYNVYHSTTKINVTAKKKYEDLELIDMEDEVMSLIGFVREEFEFSNEKNVIVTEGYLSLKLSGQKKSADQVKSADDAYFKRQLSPAYNPYFKVSLALNDYYHFDSSSTKIDVTAKKKYGFITLRDMENDVMDLFLRVIVECLRLPLGGNVTVTEGELIVKVSGPKNSADDDNFKKQSLPLDEYSNVDYLPTMINVRAQKKDGGPTLLDKVDDIQKKSADKDAKRGKNGLLFLLLSFIIVSSLSKYLLF